MSRQLNVFVQLSHGEIMRLWELLSEGSQRSEDRELFLKIMNAAKRAERSPER